MTLEFSRRDWFRGLFAALVGGWASRAAKAGAAAAAPGAADVASSTLTYGTYLGGHTTTVVYDAADFLPTRHILDQVTTFVYDAATGKRVTGGEDVPA